MHTGQTLFISGLAITNNTEGLEKLELSRLYIEIKEKIMGNTTSSFEKSSTVQGCLQVPIYSRHQESIKWVDQLFLDSVRDQVRETIPYLREHPDQNCTLKEMYLEADWASLSKGDQHLAGECMVHLVEHTDELPEVRITRTPRTGSIKYGYRQPTCVPATPGAPSLGRPAAARTRLRGTRWLAASTRISAGHHHRHRPAPTSPLGSTTTEGGRTGWRIG